MHESRGFKRIGRATLIRPVQGPAVRQGDG
jgi:hypothetical protein